MTNSKSTKRALVTSALAILMCVAMLIGTTFAWFTDTASTGVNKIVSGNLKMEVSYKNTSDGEFAVLNENTNVFMENALWEPGHVEYAVLNVKNVGNLALKYKLGINIASETGSTNVNGKEFKLSDYIKFAVIDGEADVTDRDALVAAAEAADSKLINEGYSKESQLKTATDTNEALKNDETVTLVVWMPTTVGNDANYAPGAAVPEINLGINVVATQYTYESDSFNDQYDKDAKYPATVSAIKAEYGVDGLSMPEGVKIAKAADGVNGHFDITLEDEEAFLYFTQVFDRQAALAARTEALNNGTATKYEGESVHNPLNIWYYENAVTLKMGCDIDLHGATVNPFSFGGIYFDGQGHTIKNAKLSATSGNVGFFAGGVTPSNVVFDNIQVSATGCECAGVVLGSTNTNITNVTVKNCSVIGGKYTGAVVGYNYGSIVNCAVEDTVVSGQYKVGGIIGFICSEKTTEHRDVTGNKLTNVAVKGENLLTDKSAFVIGKVVGHWNNVAGSGTCKDNTFSGTTTATENIGLKTGNVTEN